MPNSSEWENSIYKNQAEREQKNPDAWNGICAGNQIIKSNIHAANCPIKIYAVRGEVDKRSEPCFKEHINLVREKNK